MADLNSTVIKGKLKVTDDINGVKVSSTSLVTTDATIVIPSKSGELLLTSDLVADPYPSAPTSTGIRFLGANGSTIYWSNSINSTGVWIPVNYYGDLKWGGGTGSGILTSTGSTVAVTSLSTSSLTAYLIGSSSTTNCDTMYTNASCYMNSGKLYASAFYASSDKRLKDNIGKPEISYLDILNNINIKEFTWKDDKEQNYNIGVIAQELKEVLPKKYVKEFVAEPKEDGQYMMVSDGKLIYIALGAIKEQQKEIDAIKERLSKLE